MRPLVVFLYSLVMSPILILFTAFVVTCVWSWLVVPALGAASMPILAAVGVVILFTYLSPTVDNFPDTEDPLEKAVLSHCLIVLKGLVVLFVSFIFSLFV